MSHGPCQPERQSKCKFLRCAACHSVVSVPFSHPRSSGIRVIHASWSQCTFRDAWCATQRLRCRVAGGQRSTELAAAHTGRRDPSANSTPRLQVVGATRPRLSSQPLRSHSMFMMTCELRSPAASSVAPTSSKGFGGKPAMSVNAPASPATLRHTQVVG